MKQNEDYIEGFLPEDYDCQLQSADDEQVLDPSQEHWLKREQIRLETNGRLKEVMEDENSFDSYVVIGYKAKDVELDKGGNKNEYYCDMNCIVENISCIHDIAEMTTDIAYALEENPLLKKLFIEALEKSKQIANSEPIPPNHDDLPRASQFHLNRFNRIYAEKYFELRGNRETILAPKEAYNISVKAMCLAVLDQINNNENVEEDFFCNFYIDEHKGDNAYTRVEVRQRKFACTYQEADAKVDDFKALCNELNIPCSLPWLE